VTSPVALENIGNVESVNIYVQASDGAGNAVKQMQWIKHDENLLG
jgi:hypothetical protein